MFAPIKPCALLLMAGVVPRLASAAPPAPATQPMGGAKSGASKPAVAKNPNKTQIGDVTITDYRSLTSPDGFKNSTLEGPDIKVETTDKKRTLHLLVLADHITTHQASGGNGSADLIGNVRYTITEQVKLGGRIFERVIQGTARRATYQQADKTLRLLDDVHATLTDPSRFLNPAVLSVGSLVMPGEGRYHVAGSAALNDIRFTPLPPPDQKTGGEANGKKADGKKRAFAFQPGTVHAHGFASGDVDTGKAARFDGPLVVIESDNPQDKSHNVFKAPHFVAGLEKDKDSLAATGGVTFDCRRTTAQGNMQTLTGTAGQITSQRGQPLILEGGVNAGLTDPATLKEPATLTATRVTATMGDDPRYVVTGSPEHTRLSFAPRTTPPVGQAAGTRPAPTPLEGANVRPANAPVPPAANSAPDAANPPVINAAPPEEEPNAQPPGLPSDIVFPTSGKTTPFVIGDIVVTAFQTATYIPEKSLLVEGPRVHFVSNDPATKSDAEINTPHLEADFVVTEVKGKDNKTHKVTALREARATNNVTYKFQQPLKKGGAQTLTGAGSTVLFTDNVTDSGAQSQIIKVLGVTKITLATPDGVTDGTGSQPDDIFTYNLLTRDLKYDTPQRTGTLVNHFRNSPGSQPADAGMASAKKPTKKKRK